MRSRQFHDALEKLTKAIREVEAVVEIMGAEHDPLASHIFVSRRHYQNSSPTKSGKRRAMAAHLSWKTACELGFRGKLDEWERLIRGTAPGGGRTHNLWLRRPTLYPVELRAQ